MILIWWAWFREPGQNKARPVVLMTLAGAVAGVFVARWLELVTPFRSRPLHAAVLGFRPPYGVPPNTLDGWSSFPSDHATLFFGLAAGLVLIEPWVGLAALAYDVVVIAFPRAYLGLHYPTDLVAGALLGVAAVLVANQDPVRRRFAPWILRFAERRPALFYAAFFGFTFELATLFDEIRSSARFLLQLSRWPG